VTLRHWPLRSWRLWLMRIIVLHPCTKLSLKFVGLDIWNMWRTMYVSINGPGDVLDLWLLKLVRELHLRCVIFLQNFGKPFGSRIVRYVRDGWTDERTDKGNTYSPFPTGGGHKKKHRRPNTIHTCTAFFRFCNKTKSVAAAGSADTVCPRPPL